MRRENSLRNVLTTEAQCGNVHRMQLKKHHWKMSRNTPRFTEAAPNLGFRQRRGGYHSYADRDLQLRSRRMNAQDPINRP